MKTPETFHSVHHFPHLPEESRVTQASDLPTAPVQHIMFNFLYNWQPLNSNLISFIFIIFLKVYNKMFLKVSCRHKLHFPEHFWSSNAAGLN